MKIKAHRDEPLNERTDDLADEGKTLAKAGDRYQWTNRTTRLVYSYYDRAAHQWKKGTWSKTIRRRADSTSRSVREVGDSIIGVMDAEDNMKQNGDKNDAGTTSHYPGNHYVDSRLLDTGR